MAETDRSSKQFLSFKKGNILQHWNHIEDINNQLWELEADPTLVGYDTHPYITLEEEVQSVLVVLSEWDAEVTSTPVANNSLNLPKITLPKFDGNYLNWRQFHDLFNEMIHKQKIANCQKLFYLKSNLVGEAERLIKHLPATDYLTACSILQERYENTRLLVNALLSKLVNQPNVVAEGADSLKRFHDTTQECVLGLHNIGIDTGACYPILLFICIRKLDKASHTLYEQSLVKQRELQSFKDFLSFLQSCFQALEASGGKSISKASTLLATNTVNCPLCGSNHPLYACKDFGKLNPGKRLQQVKRHNLCINCLKSGHSLSNCDSSGCRKCSKKHNTMLHFEGAITQPSPASYTNNSRIQPGHTKDKTSTASIDQHSVLATHAIARTKYVALGTAVVKLIDHSGATIECRALLDSDSQLNLITVKLANRLGFKGKAELLTIKGIEHANQQSQRRVNTKIASRKCNFSANFEAFLLPQITVPQPSIDIDTTSWEIPHNIKFADPAFNTPGPIDILLGADLYHDILRIGQIRLGKGLPTLQNTVFGWIVAGKIDNHYLHELTCGVLTKVPTQTQEERTCEEHFSQTVKRNALGRFVVQLSFKQKPERLGHSKDLALRRFTSLERKLTKDPTLKGMNADFMAEYHQLGHMSLIKEEEIKSPSYFLPHHGILKPSSTTTKLRVVFDASAKSSTNLALNDVLATGPTIQDDLFTILLRFRLPRFVFTARYRKDVPSDPNQRPGSKSSINCLEN